MPRPPKVKPQIGAIVSPEEAKYLIDQGRLDPAKTLGVAGGPNEWFPWQQRALTCLCDEIGLFGGKGSGKSELMRAWLIQGNPQLPERDQHGSRIDVNISYTNHPNYRALILRRNEKDLDDFINRSAHIYGQIGGMYSEGRFRFPSGATIDCGHMKDKNSWQKYIGIEYQRIVIDEAALIPDYDSIEELRSCMRSPYPELRCQLMMASNCSGPGVSWIMERYMNVKDQNGLNVPHDTIIRETFVHPVTGERRPRTRIWMFSTLRDNPVYARTDYGITLMALADPKKRAAYLDGVWDALWGSYFGDVFRPEGPRASMGDPPEANHVIRKTVNAQQEKRYPIELSYWWPRHISYDWGYTHESAIYWGAKSPEPRVYVYRELVQSQMTADRAGMEIALASRDELERIPSKSMTLWLSWECFGTREGDRSIAELVALGIARVLGPDKVHVPDVLIQKLTDAYAGNIDNIFARQHRDEAIEQLRLQQKIGITIRRADRASTIGWQHMREMLRWERIGTPNAQFDRDTYSKILRDDGISRASEYARTFRDVKPEVLPKLQIFDCCPRLIQAIPKLQHEEGTEDVNPDHFKGRDSCFVAGTLISTARGDVPIEEIVVGDRVWTRLGFRPVTASGMSSQKAKVISLHLSNGKTLTGTPNHPVWVHGKGFTRMDALLYNDVLWSMQSYTTVGDIEGTRNPNVSISNVTTGTPPQVLSTSMSGVMPTDRFQRSGKSTTRITTLSTIRLKISNVSHARFMPASIELDTSMNCRRHTWHEFGLSRRSGMPPPKEENGIGSTDTMAGKTPPINFISASFAEENLRAGTIAVQPFVQPIATRRNVKRVELTTSNAFASFAESPLIATDTSKKPPARVRVLTSCSAESGSVYNLSVQGQPEYFANGVLVHNCDSLLYLLLGVHKTVSVEPYEAFRETRIQDIKSLNPAMDVRDLIWVQRKLEDEWNDQHRSPAPYTPPRKARMQRLISSGRVNVHNNRRVN